ncbi:hypothetical protein GCM10010277_76980 [Streptomyces longisporoflavus]|uniref:hypothetical protein n=1 Tax=Streptomyces longisporoflavus TaxID=28044 RepID=UPI00167F16C2|nr:hypothetical protein [Streptomyces longisporoflavus]GGV68008.1 hypothetical protein GCM10010277_76980 [Streptomyces longisporoflavus]
MTPAAARTPVSLPPLIAEHDTWITLDPVLGCPANCAYCYLGTVGMRAVKPFARVTARELADLVRRYLHGRRAEVIDPQDDLTPLCLGNHTDMLMSPENRRATIEVLRELSRRIPPRTMVLITKSVLREDLVAEIDAIGWPVVWFFSQSLAHAAGVPLEAGRTADLEETLANARMVSASRNQHAVHFWRPFVRELHPDAAGLETVIEALRTSGMRCSVLSGLRLGPGVPQDDPRLRTHLAATMRATEGMTEVFDRERWVQLVHFGRKAEYPLYRHSSCALALVHSAREQLGTWNPAVFADRCIPCSCPARQRQLCAGSTPQTGGLLNDPAELQARTARFLRIGHRRLLVDEAQKQLHVDAAVSEFDYNTMLHALRGRYVVVARSIVWRRAWESGWPAAARRHAKDGWGTPFEGMVP